MPGKAESVLLVDDLPANLLVYRTILEDAGQNLVTASSGEEALKLILKQDFAVILLDVNMPTMNGFETVSLIRKRKKSASTPIIFLTAFTDEMHMIKGYASGAVDFLPTPVVPEILKAKVRVFIELSRMRRQVAVQAEERVRREAAEEAAQRSVFLAMASENLARSQNQAEFLRALAMMSVPPLADISIARLRENETSPGLIEWHHVAAGPEVQASALKLSDFPWLDKITNEMMEAGGPPRLLEIPASPNEPMPLGLGNWASAVAMPLMVQGHPCGVLILARLHAEQAYQVKEMSLAGDLAYRAGLALEKIMLVERIREADRRKDEFLGMLAHELRNPLGPIYNCLQLQKRLPPTDPRLAGMNDIIDRQTKQMGRLIDDLLDATRLAHGKILLRKERCDLTKIVRQTVDDYRPVVGSGLKLDLHSPEKSLWIDGDPTRLVQIIGNLLHNAHKFSKQDGVITVRLTAEKNDSTAVISVSDTGIGIEPLMLRYIFDAFRQAEQGLDRSRGGLGLGLALVKGLVELHGGFVQASSPGLDQGAEFTIRLPLMHAQQALLPPESGAPPAGGAKQRILVIEDNRDAAESIQMLLRLEGHDVKVALTAQSGLEIAHDFLPQVILCDIGLPVMDGYQIIQAIRQSPALASTYVIAWTGYGREQDQRRALDSGFDMHLTKPVDYDNLRRALARAERVVPTN